MKTVVDCKRVLMYNTLEDRVVAILHDRYKPSLSDQDILCHIFSPYTMAWAGDTELWIRDSHIRFEIFYEYKEVETWIDKVKKWFS